MSRRNISLSATEGTRVCPMPEGSLQRKNFAWEMFAWDERQVDSLTHIKCQDLPATKHIRAITLKKYHILFAPKKSKSLTRKKNKRGREKAHLGFAILL